MRPLFLTPLVSCLLSTPLFAFEELRVTQTGDSLDGRCDSHCTLRDAVQVANQLPGTQRILLGAGVYRLELPAPQDAQGVPYDEDANRNGDLDILDHLLIQGSGASQLSGSAASRDRLLDVAPGVSLGLLNLSLENGSSAYNGGAVRNRGHLHLGKVDVRNNRASTQNPSYQEMPGELGYRSGQGGGIANYGTLIVHASRFENNRAWGYGDNNLGRGGAIFNRGSLQVRDSTFSGNSAADESERSAGGALYNAGVADVARSIFSANRGSEGGRGFAIANDDNGQLKLSNSTLSGHYGTGGALSNGYYANPASNDPSAQLIHVTIAGNSGFGVRNSGQLRIRNSLIAGNLGVYEDEVTNCRNEGPHYRYQASGLLLNSEPSDCSADLYLDYAQTFEQLLLPLADNGGRTATFALRPGSLALDAAVGSCAGHDQRGLPRPQDGDGDGVVACDLGAYELTSP
ncbi:MAG: right-handed parallel beta-helix repeat-containing protein [Pseudomonas sp.]|uniref:choice-of-anchor Q domain-containing protein n=1 Tax=Pseudomonas sp. TaxID=306 RepID=UPI00339154A4